MERAVWNLRQVQVALSLKRPPFPGMPLVLRLSAHGCSLLRLSAPGAETQCPWLLPADTQCPLVPRLSARGCSLLRLTAPLC